MHEYFANKNYKYIYLESMFYNFGSSLIETFGTVMLYKNNISIKVITLVYLIRFLITAMITPLFLILSKRIGIAKSLAISNIFSIISVLMILLIKDIKSYLVILTIILGLMGLSNSSSDMLSSKYIDYKNRGRFNSIFNITKIIASIVAVIITAFGVLSNNNILLFIIISLSFILQFIFLLKIDYKPDSKINVYKETFNYIRKDKSKYKYLYFIRSIHFIERSFIPLYLYIILNSFKSLTIVVVISLLLQIITVFFIGKYLDNNKRNSSILVTIVKIFVTLSFILFRGKTVMSVIKVLNDNIEKVYDTYFSTNIQNIINENNCRDVLANIGQVLLNLGQVIILGIMLLFNKDLVFYIVFIISIIADISIYFLSKKNTTI